MTPAACGSISGLPQSRALAIATRNCRTQTPAAVETGPARSSLDQKHPIQGTAHDAQHCDHRL